MKKVFLLFILVAAFCANSFAQTITRPIVPFAGYKTALQIAALRCSTRGTLVWDTTNLEYNVCTATGTPGTWQAIGSGGGGAADSPLELTAATASETPLTINLAALQTADAFVLNNSSASQILGITKDGHLRGDTVNQKLILSSGSGAFLQYNANNYLAIGSSTTTVGTNGGYTFIFGSALSPSSAFSDLGVTTNKWRDVFASRFVVGGKGANVASAAAIAPTGNLFHVTGTTTITSIDATGIEQGTCFTIIFDGALTLTDGSNLKLAGNFVTTADDTISLCYDGTAFFEKSRAVN